MEKFPVSPFITARRAQCDELLNGRARVSFNDHLSGGHIYERERETTLSGSTAIALHEETKQQNKTEMRNRERERERAAF